jgi:hypothetical protein
MLKSWKTNAISSQTQSSFCRLRTARLIWTRVSCGVRLLIMRNTSEMHTALRSCASFVLAFMVAAVMMACSSSKPPAEESSAGSGPKPASQAAPLAQVGPTDKILGNVESLTATPESQSSLGILRAQGWAVSAVSGAPVITVTLLVDGNPVAETATFELRPDVAAAFGRPDFEKSGWKIEVPLKKLGPGKHPVTIRAINKNGDKLTVPGVSLTLD